jgi:PqqD family protein of HPr-rel-A system
MQRLKDLATSDTGFVFDPYSGATFTANASALAILDCLKRGMGRAATVEALRERFDASSEDLPRDIDELVQSLRLFGLVPSDYEVA